MGKRVRYRADGSKVLKACNQINLFRSQMFSCFQVFLDSKERNATEYKLDTFMGVYKNLTGREVIFDYPTQEIA